MNALSARNPMLSDPHADCVAGKSLGFPRRRSGESKLTGRPVRQHAQTADHCLVQACQPGRKCLPELGYGFQTRAPRKYAILGGLGHAVAHMRWCAGAKLVRTNDPGRNCTRMDNHRCGLRGKIINDPSNGSSRLARASEGQNIFSSGDWRMPWGFLLLRRFADPESRIEDGQPAGLAYGVWFLRQIQRPQACLAPGRYLEACSSGPVPKSF